VRLPPFWAQRPAVWFAQAEAQFFLTSINNEKTNFCHVNSQLDHRYVAELEDIITSPPELDPYTKMRTELMRRISPSKEQRIRQLLTTEIRDRQPYRILRHLRSLAPDVPEVLLHTIGYNRLPPNIQNFFVGQPVGGLDAAAHCADRISEFVSQTALASVGPHPTAQHFCRGSRTSLSRWQHSALSGIVFTSAPGTVAPNPGIPASAPGTAACTADPFPEATPRPTPAGNIAAMEPEGKSVLSPAPTASSGSQLSRHHRRHVSAVRRQAASSFRIDLVNGCSWSTRFSTSAFVLAGSSRDTENGSNTTSVQLTALPSTPTYGCLSGSTWGYAWIRGG
jgi:hypothetical protein